MAQLEGHKVSGSTHAGYLPAKDAPFSCATCEYFTWPHLCRNELVEKDAKLKQQGLRLHQSGKAIVEPLSCCSLWEKT